MSPPGKAKGVNCRDQRPTSKTLAVKNDMCPHKRHKKPGKQDHIVILWGQNREKVLEPRLVSVVLACA